MSWSTATPAGTDLISLGDDNIRELKTDIAAALTKEGVFPGTDVANPVFKWTGKRGAILDRPASPDTGELFFNTELLLLEYWNGAAWTAYDLVPLLAITTGKLADGVVTDVKVTDVAAGKITGQIVAAQITDFNITADKISNNAVADAKIVSLSAAKVIGNPDGTAPPDGSIGEEKVGTTLKADAISLSTTVYTNIIDLTLSAGCFEVWGCLGLTNLTTTGYYFTGVISANSGNDTSDHVPGRNLAQTGGIPYSGVDHFISINPYRINSNLEQHVYLKAKASSVSGNPKAFGSLIAIRKS